MAKSAVNSAVSDGEALLLRASENIQGNILASFNKPRQRFVFISFRNTEVESDRRQSARDWLGKLVNAGIASTKQVVEHGEARKEAAGKGGKPETRQWVGVSFTSSGLVTLNPDYAANLAAYDAFWHGALVDREYGGQRRASPAVVGDVRRGDPARWIVGGPGQYPVDALVTIAGDDDNKFWTRADDELARAKSCGLTVLSWQDCRRLGDENDHAVDPFGFRDGISQPGVLGFNPSVDRDGYSEVKGQPGTPIIASGEFVLGRVGEEGSYLDVRRPVAPGWMYDGSFQVFLRLRQDVEGWQTQMRELSESSDHTIDAAALAIGRTADGEPLAAPDTGGGFNDFTHGDPQGSGTPRFAHIYKMNPRSGDERTHRLLRRAIPFNERLQDATRPSVVDGGAGTSVEQAEHGLAFNAFMASIEHQFEFLQRSWASNPDSFPLVAADGPDPVIGTSEAPCVLRGANGQQVEIHFGRFVWTTGAVYAFAPSLSALRRLAGLDEIQAKVT